MAQKPRVWELRNLGAKRQEIMGKLSRAVSSSKNYWVEKFFSWLTIQRRSVWVGQLRELNGLTSPRVENSWKKYDCIITNCFEMRVEMNKWWVVLLLKNNRLVVLQEKWTALKENTGVQQKRGQVLNQCYVIHCLSEVDNDKRHSVTFTSEVECSIIYLRLKACTMKPFWSKFSMAQLLGTGRNRVKARFRGIRNSVKSRFSAMIWCNGTFILCNSGKLNFVEHLPMKFPYLLNQ